MTMISYAQNFEDVMLWRALKHVKDGFYVDVGANDPEVDSVTKFFYDQGWHGVNIEPLASHYDSLVNARTRDINIRCAVGDKPAELNIWECEIRGWATLNADVAKEHEQNGHVGVWHKVSVSPLSEILSDYHNSDIHFIKIDVEGFESQVIRGNDWLKIRPWIIVVEATQPNSQIESFSDWEPVLIDAGYHFVYMDGLNRFYISNEHNELDKFFRYPPNVYDDFISDEEMKLRIELQKLESDYRSQLEIANRLANDFSNITNELNNCKEQVEYIYLSSSWRVTKPLRFLSSLVRRFFKQFV